MMSLNNAAYPGPSGCPDLDISSVQTTFDLAATSTKPRPVSESSYDAEFVSSPVDNITMSSPCSSSGCSEIAKFSNFLDREAAGVQKCSSRYTAPRLQETFALPPSRVYGSLVASYPTPRPSMSTMLKMTPTLTIGSKDGSAFKHFDQETPVVSVNVPVDAWPASSTIQRLPVGRTTPSASHRHAGTCLRRRTSAATPHATRRGIFSDNREAGSVLKEVRALSASYSCSLLTDRSHFTAYLSPAKIGETVLTLSEPDDDDVSSIGSIDDDDVDFFLTVPNSSRLKPVVSLSTHAVISSGRASATSFSRFGTCSPLTFGVMPPPAMVPPTAVTLPRVNADRTLSSNTGGPHIQCDFPCPDPTVSSPRPYIFSSTAPCTATCDQNSPPRSIYTRVQPLPSNTQASLSTPHTFIPSSEMCNRGRKFSLRPRNDARASMNRIPLIPAPTFNTVGRKRQREAPISICVDF